MDIIWYSLYIIQNQKYYGTGGVISAETAPNCDLVHHWTCPCITLMICALFWIWSFKYWDLLMPSSLTASFLEVNNHIIFLHSEYYPTVALPKMSVTLGSLLCEAMIVPASVISRTFLVIIFRILCICRLVCGIVNNASQQQSVLNQAHNFFWMSW